MPASAIIVKRDMVFRGVEISRGERYYVFEWLSGLAALVT